MTRTLRPSVLAASVLVSLVAAVGLAACGNSPSNPSTSSASPSVSASASPSPSASSASPTTGMSGAAGPARCLSTQLSASIGQGAGGAAGHFYAKIVLTNTGSTPCLLSGFAGLSLTDGPNGGPIGAPADRDTSVPVVDVVLNPGQAGAADFGITQAANYVGSCTQVQAAGLRIYPPEDFGSLFIPDQQTACSETSIHLLTLKAFQPMA
ncbi:DUF4232 domain-containing protein [Sinomonas sp. JGH33]|uniref:DUF4232 domain-containing protein n=1 Tax=Sinomonas terricola TaxID=3110330 RepID=A0ABU5TBX1_9MICC|nr:DUF4232 domain-containing protein [Sinomonas sp. JGH33]MEA5457032.1 DUF4232 domain-containing protein [Sinomonas sp. JGH33]